MAGRRRPNLVAAALPARRTTHRPRLGYTARSGRPAPNSRCLTRWLSTPLRISSPRKPTMADAPAATPAKKGRKPKDGAAKTAKSSRPPTMQLVRKAIEADKDPKGTSVMAIKKHILATNKVKSAQFLNHMLRRAFETGLKAGSLCRPKGQGDNGLLTGRYRITVKERAAAKPKPRKAAKPPAKKTTKPKKAATPKRPAGAAKKAKSPKKVKKTTKKPASEKTAAKKTPKKAAKKA